LTDRAAAGTIGEVSATADLTAPGALVRDGRVRISVHGGVAFVHLNRPDKLNAFDAEQIEAFESALRWFAEADQVRVGVIAGSDRAFCVGGDITTFDAIDVEAGYPYTRRGYDILRSLETNEKPMIAAVEGHCLAGGLEVALACDFIIAGATAKFGFGELDLGLIPAWGGTVRLTRAIPARLARQLILTSERLDAARATEVGLVNEVVEAGSALERALELARRIAAQPPIAVRIANTVARVVADGADIESALAAERIGGALLFGTSDVHRAVQTWSEK
jgi:enoyl-CoA hydratase/carnithine racemase